MMNQKTEKLLLDSAAIAEAVARLGEAVLQDFRNTPDFVLIGLHKQGVPLAFRLADILEKASGIRPAVGKLDISMYRDDIGLRSSLPRIRETEIPFNMEGAKVLLVDDVLSSGRAVRAALDAVTSFGRPALIRLAVLIDRGKPEYPIRADYVGRTAYQVDPSQKIVVNFSENSGGDAACTVQWHRDGAEMRGE